MFLSTYKSVILYVQPDKLVTYLLSALTNVLVHFDRFHDAKIVFAKILFPHILMYSHVSYTSTLVNTLSMNFSSNIQDKILEAPNWEPGT